MNITEIKLKQLHNQDLNLWLEQMAMRSPSHSVRDRY